MFKKFLMKRLTRILLVIGSVLILSSTVALCSIEKLFSPMAWFVGVNTLVITGAFTHIERRNSARLFSAYLIMFLLAYALTGYSSAGEIKLVTFAFQRSVAIALRSIICFYLIGFAVFGAFYQSDFAKLKSKTAFKVAVILLAIFLLIELPVYNIHPDFGGNSHGHPLWKSYHFH